MKRKFRLITIAGLLFAFTHIHAGIAIIEDDWSKEGTMGIICADGYKYLFFSNKTGNSLVQMFSNESGKSVPVKCQIPKKKEYKNIFEK